LARTAISFGIPMNGTRAGVAAALSRRGLLIGAAALAATRPACATPTPPKMSGYVGDYYPFDAPQALPPISFAGSSNESHGLAELSGKVVLLNFWATWCAPCLAELPDLDRLQSLFSRDQFIVLALCEDAQSITTIKKYYARRNVEGLGGYMDPFGAALRAYAVPALPTSFILDRAGRTRGILPGAAPWASPEARALIAYYLNEGRGGAA
jgi:thiol-disulfide isomerase/thioredoxin